MCDFMKQKSFNEQNVGKAMWEMTELYLYYSKEKCRFWKCSWNMKTLRKSFSRLACIEGFWLLKDFRFWVFIKLHFPSDSREAVVLLSQPESKWNGCRQFQGVRKSSCGKRDHASCVKKLCCSSRMGSCVSQHAKAARWALGEMPRRYNFHHRHDPIVEAYV